MERIAFPGFGWEFNIDRTAIHDCFGIEGFDIQWYGIILAVGICLAFLLFYRFSVKREQIDPDSVYNIALFTVPIAVIGARAFYVIAEWESTYKGTGFLNIINIRNGGLAIYGGIIFGLITVLIYCKIKKINAYSVLDALAPAVMVGQAIGRWGNFVNGEAYGWSKGIDSLPWRMELDYVKVDGNFIADTAPYTACVHPTFLYESLWNVLGLALILLFVYRRKKFEGQVFFAYLGWYGLGRAFIEYLRADSLYIPSTSIKLSVFIGILCVIAAVIGFIVRSKQSKEEALELAEYSSPYSAVIAAVTKEGDALAEKEFDADASETAEESEAAESTDAEDDLKNEADAPQALADPDDALSGDTENTNDTEDTEQQEQE